LPKFYNFLSKYWQ